MHSIIIQQLLVTQHSKYKIYLIITFKILTNDHAFDVLLTN